MDYKIPVGASHYALVSKKDYWEFKDYAWYLVTKDVVYRKLFYAARNMPNGKSRYMHRQIMEAKEGEVIHHINGNGLDNRRGNLMITDIRTNSGYRHHPVTSKYPGVCKKSGKKPWQADIKINNKTIYIGRFEGEKEAHNARELALALYKIKLRPDYGENYL